MCRTETNGAAACSSANVLDTIWVATVSPRTATGTRTRVQSLEMRRILCITSLAISGHDYARVGENRAAYCAATDPSCDHGVAPDLGPCRCSSSSLASV